MLKFNTAFFLFWFLVSCGTQTKSTRPRPEWINNRPVNSMYYIGVGISSKASNPNEYQTIAKRNALNDLISEIQVTISTNSVLSQYQSNDEFKQQFESDSRLSARNSIEEFEVVDSWETNETFWIYYRLSKEKYAEVRRRKMMAAVDRAENFYTEARRLDMFQNYMPALRMKIKALAALQDYLSENIYTTVDGKEVLFVNELINSIQQQLYAVKLSTEISSVKGKVGKAISEPINISAVFNTAPHINVLYLPITPQAQSGKMKFGNQSETDAKGQASFSIHSIQSKDPLQSVRIVPDLKRIINVDSLNGSLTNILLRLDVPGTMLRVQVEPLRVYFEGNERNLSKALASTIFEATLKRQLTEFGCQFVRTREESDYILKVTSDTKSLGNIWGNMQQSSLDMTIILTETRNDVDVFKDALQSVKGYQTTPENAGLDAYKTANSMLLEKVYPRLIDELTKAN